MPESLFAFIAPTLAILNFISFAVYAFDKSRARRNKRRIPESTLILLAAFGGSAGALLAMTVLRHKTRKPLFRYGVPVLLFLHLVCILFFCQGMMR